MTSAHFSDSELRCKCCGQNFVKVELLNLAERVRHELGDHAMHPTSVCRCEKNNAKAGGAADSQHVKGLAMDFYIKEIPAEEVYERLKALREEGKLLQLKGLFLYKYKDPSKNFVHIDCRKDSYRTKVYYR